MLFISTAAKLQKSCLHEEKDLHQKKATRIESQGEWRGQTALVFRDNYNPFCFVVIV